MIKPGFRFPVTFVCTRLAERGEMVNGSELINASNKFWAKPSGTDMPEMLCCSDAMLNYNDLREVQDSLDRLTAAIVERKRGRAVEKPFLEISPNWPAELIEQLRNLCQKNNTEFRIMK